MVGLPIPSGDEQGTSVGSANGSMASHDTEPLCTPDVAASADGVSLSGIDMFVRIRANRRVRLPASFRRGRHQRAGARPPRHSKVGATTPQWIHLVDVDGDAETTRIELRRRFEDISNAQWMPDVQESAAG
jgi:hypothetical protein